MGSILTFKIKHSLDLQLTLAKLIEVVEKALLDKNGSSRNFKEFHLPSRITADTARKYLKIKNLKSVRSVKGVIGSEGGTVIKYNQETSELYITCLKWRQKVSFPRKIVKVNQIEFDSLYFYVSCSVESLEPKDVTTSLGVDFNTKGNTCFIALKDSGLAFPVGVSLRDVSINYTNRIAALQSKAKFSLANKLSRKRFRVMDDNYHKVSRQIVDLAVENNAGIVLEDLTGLRKGKVKKEFGKSSWGFYKLRQFIEYKAKLAGIPVQLINPRNTSKTCSRCGHVHDKPISGKVFNCKNCGYNSHRDLNAAFNIACLGHFESTSKELDLEEGCQTCQPEQVEFLDIRKTSLKFTQTSKERG